MSPDQQRGDVDVDIDQGVLDRGFVDHDPLFDGATMILCAAVLYQVEPEMFESVFSAAFRFSRQKVRFMSVEKTVVHEARNRLAYRFLNTDATYLQFIDQDILYPCGSAAYFNRRGKKNLPEWQAGLNFIERMMAHSASYGVIGGSYFDRVKGTDLQCSRGCGQYAEAGFNESYRSGQVRGIGEVLWTATGAMRIHRKVFEVMREEGPKIFPEIVPGKGDIYGFFTPVRVGAGEDVSFCYRARRLGFKIWQDYDLRVLHKGTDFK